MIKKYHNSISIRLAAALLLMLGIIGLAGLPVMAESESTGECLSPLTNEIHTYDPSIDKAMCPEPIADFCAYPREGCDSLLVMFTDLSQGYIDTWSWDFGDPSSGADNFSNEENPSHLYRSTGLYTITLTVVGPGGTDTETKEHFVRIKTSPVADFEFSMNGGCQATTVNFTDLSTWADTWYWTFGDGAYSTEQNPTHTYASAGTYTVTLKAYNECGRSIKERQVVITTGAPPVADFTSDITSGCETAEVSFYDRSTYATTWHWDFGDGATSDEQNPKHTYTVVGKYTVTLTVTNECGEDRAVKTEYINILSQPIADFTSDVTETCVGAEVQFTDLSLYAAAWWWDFGDGTSSTEQNPTHAYLAPGKYTVTLKAYNSCGRDMKIRELYITVHPLPIADFTSDITEGCTDATVNFTDQSQYADTWEWDFGDGGTSFDQNPSHTYNSSGRYTVTLKVTNDCGNDDEIKTEYVVIYPEPVADFSADVTTTCVGGMINFTDLSNYAESWAWDFGDGATSTERNPGHAYSAAGTYTITLAITNKCGNDDEVKVDYITIYPEPIADFTSDTREICEGETVSFTDQSSHALIWSWDFGDGATSNEKNPSHAYMTAGIYTVSLTVQNPCGEDDTVAVNYVTVNPKPTADFTSDNVEGCVGTDISFTSLAANADSVKWEFGDGTASNETNPSHAYTSEGTYSVKLTAYNSCGTDEEIKEEYIKIYSEPTANFTSDIVEGCQALTVIFVNLSNGSSRWSWDFGDGATSSEQNPSHTYNAAGVYTVALTSYNSCGDDTETKTDYIIVHPGPTADFSATPRSGEPPLTVNFTDLSTSALSIKSWSWDFGDYGTSTERNPQHIYTTPGTYTVTLSVTDDCGNDSESKQEYIYVSDTCKIDFAYEPPEGCAPLMVSFSATSTGPCEVSSWTWDFGDPNSGGQNTAAGRITSHTYNTPGVYSVKLTGEDVSGTKVITKTDCIAVYGKPSAFFTASTMQGIAPMWVQFDDLSVANAPVISWLWDFGDPSSGDDNTSELQNPSHHYENVGTYTVTLITTNECGKDTASVEVVLLPPLTITKTVDKAIAVEGDTLLYTLTVENTSNYSIGNIFVIDSIPDSTAYVDGSVTGGGSYDAMENRMSWSIIAIPNGYKAELSFKVILDGPFTTYPTIVSNKAYAIIMNETAKPISSRTFESNTVQTTVDKTTQLIEISKEVSATLAYPGDALTYTITVTNRNMTAANNVIIYDAIPELTSYVDGSISAGGTYYPATDSLVWNIGTLNPLESRAVSFGVTINTGVPNGQKIPNTALVRSSSGDNQSNMVITAVSLTPIVVTKTAGRPSGMIGDLIRYTITIENYSGDLFMDVHLTDTLPGGIFYVKGSSLLDGAALADPTGDNPIVWSLGDLPASGTMTVEYTALIGASAHPGINENIARAQAYQGGEIIHSNRAIAQIHVLGYTLSGSIRGRVIVDCDGDGIADMETGPVGMDVYLDDGSHSKVNEKGMFYFSTVRPGERVVALDERDLDGFFIPEDAQSSVFVHVHETGESYVIFRVCPDYPHLAIHKQAAIVPAVKVVKTAQLNPEQKKDSLGVLLDYMIDIKSNGHIEPTTIKVIDTLPAYSNYIADDRNAVKPRKDGEALVYETTISGERTHQTLYYSLRDLIPGMRKYISNKVQVEGTPPAVDMTVPVVSKPAEVSVGPLMLAPPKDVQITLTPALFITSKADLQKPAIPLLEAVADSIVKYADAEVKVEGHTDYRRIHTIQFPSNWELGDARAKAVVDWLVDNRDIDRDRLEYESFAATHPIVTIGHTSVQLQPNRRTEVIIRAKSDGFLAPGISPDQLWQDSTILSLTPAAYDTLFETNPGLIEAGFEDSWDVFLTIENRSAITAVNSILTDIIPEGAAYIENSAGIDGMSISATVNGKTLRILIEKIEPFQKLELHYRIRATGIRVPTGGGAASVEVTTSNNLSVVQKSNEVRF